MTNHDKFNLAPIKFFSRCFGIGALSDRICSGSDSGNTLMVSSVRMFYRTESVSMRHDSVDRASKFNLMIQIGLNYFLACTKRLYLYRPDCLMRSIYLL